MARLAGIVALGLGALAAPFAVGAQPSAKIPRIGVIQVGVSGPFFEAFKQGMREQGYVEGRHFTFEYRLGENKPDRIREAVAELVRMKVDVIVTSTDQGVAAVRQQTRTIPIVMATSTDPVATGFVASLARPGGNITGNSNLSPELNGKRLELLREVLPGLSRLAILWNPDVRGGLIDYKEMEGVARSLQMQVQSYEVSRAEDFEGAFTEMTAERAQAVFVPAGNPLAYVNRARIVGFAQRSRLPVMFGIKDYVDAGGLMAYGPDSADLWRRSAGYVDKILKGAKPGDLPIQQPTKFELSINLRTAKTLGLTIPASLVRRADHVIQ